MQPADYLETKANEPAVAMAESGEVVTYGELEARSRRLAQLLHAAGLRPRDHIAVMLENHPRYFEVYWAAQRSGLYITPINWHLKAEEAGYIVEDCGAQALVTSARLGALAQQLEPHLGGVTTRLAVDADVPGYDRYESAIEAFPAERLEREVEGMYMFYSSGTTGRPKGIMPPLGDQAFGAAPPPMLVGLVQFLYGMSADTVYLCPAPLYHAAPLGWTTAVQRLGGVVVVMEKFEPARALALIEQHRITHAQFVPTHFVRMLKLDPAERVKYDVSSLRAAVHAAAPCPVEVKERMLEWWGKRIFEYYSGSEGGGFCAIGPDEWLAHRGSVGKPMMGSIHIVDEEGKELPTGQPGQVWFESGARFEYHNDPEKTAKAFNEKGWSTLGDVGYLDADGFLYLTDRISHMIISGGVNIYPQEIENQLTMHPAVVDVAVIGVPHAEMGEEVKAVVIPAEPARAGRELEAELIAYCREHIAHYKCPASVDFVDELPRLPTGKLLKRELRDRYWGKGAEGEAMSLTLEKMTNGLTPEHDLFFSEKPDQPEMRESTSIWLFEENGEFALPRIGIEGEASSWDDRLYQANFALGGGRVLDGAGRGPVPSPFGPDGRATVFGAGPLTFRCIEPFRSWAMTFDGTAVDGTVAQQISRTLDVEKRTPIRVDVEMEMATPAWVQDNSPDKVAKMSAAEAAEATSMGIGWRLEHTFRAKGTLCVDGVTRDFRAVGSRIKRQSLRPLTFFRGHCWQSALFPDGRAFGYITYPPAGDGSEPYNEGYIFQDGKMYPARAIKIPWLRRLVADGDDVSLELESDLGVTRIGGRSTLTTFKILGTGHGTTTDFNLQQGGARYTWDGMTSYGMIERSTMSDQLTG